MYLPILDPVLKYIPAVMLCGSSPPDQVCVPLWAACILPIIYSDKTHSIAMSWTQLQCEQTSCHTVLTSLWAHPCFPKLAQQIRKGVLLAPALLHSSIASGSHGHSRAPCACRHRATA